MNFKKTQNKLLKRVFKSYFLLTYNIFVLLYVMVNRFLYSITNDNFIYGFRQTLSTKKPEDNYNDMEIIVSIDITLHSPTITKIRTFSYIMEGVF